jgi:hypothetical protein
MTFTVKAATVANQQFNDDPFRPMGGIGNRQLPTAEFSRKTLG